MRDFGAVLSIEDYFNKPDQDEQKDDVVYAR